MFAPIALNGAGGTIRFDLSAIPAALRTGYGWAIGGVDGNQNAGGGSNFISLTEVSATGGLVPEPTSALIWRDRALRRGLVPPSPRDRWIRARLAKRDPAGPQQYY